MNLPKKKIIAYVMGFVFVFVYAVGANILLGEVFSFVTTFIFMFVVQGSILYADIRGEL